MARPNLNRYPWTEHSSEVLLVLAGPFAASMSSREHGLCNVMLSRWRLAPDKIETQE